MARITIGSASDVGMRDDNEDSLLAAVAQDSSTQAGFSGNSITSAALLILADGMGGRSHGEVASETATTVIYKELAHVLGLRKRVDSRYLSTAIRRAISKANTKINEIVSTTPDSSGMGTTVACAVVVYDLVCVAHVGDSRAYLLDGESSGLRLLTEDHSVVQNEVRAGRLTAEEARRSKFRNVITRAVGVDDTVDADLTNAQLPPGSILHLVLSSDGMHGSVSEFEIERILRENSEAQDAADALVAAARANGAHDNISTIVAKIDTRYTSDSYGAIGLDGMPHSADSDSDLKEKQPAFPWLTKANMFAFAIGMVITAVIAWQLFPTPSSVKQAPPSVVPTGTVSKEQLKIEYSMPAAIYQSPTVLLKNSLAHNLLIPQGGPVFLVGDMTTHNLLSINEETGAVVGFVPEQGALTTGSSATERGGVFTTGDGAGDRYESLQNPPEILKNISINSKPQAIGVGMLTAPGAIAIAANGDILVIDNGTLKRFKAVLPAK